MSQIRPSWVEHVAEENCVLKKARQWRHRARSKSQHRDSSKIPCKLGLLQTLERFGIAGRGLLQRAGAFWEPETNARRGGLATRIVSRSLSGSRWKNHRPS